MLSNAAASDTTAYPTVTSRHSRCPHRRSSQLDSLSLTPSNQFEIGRVTCIPRHESDDERARHEYCFCGCANLVVNGDRVPAIQTPNRLSIGTPSNHPLPILPTLSGRISYGSDTVDRPSHSRHLVKHSQESVSGSGSEGTAIPPQPNEEPGVTTTSPWYMRILAVFTTYGDLAVANTPEEFGLVHTRLQKEWTFEGSFLVGLSAVNTAMFAITSDSIFKVNSYARTAVAISSAACGLGIACDAWLILRYGWVDLRTFIDRSRDVYGLYAFFSLSSRMPTFCALISSISLMSFLGLTAYDAKPVVVLVMGVSVVLVMILQFIVYGATSTLRVWRAGSISASEV